MHRCIVKVKRVRPYNTNPLPDYMTQHASGMDLYAELNADVLLQPGERMLIPSGVALEIPPGYEAQVRPRSGLALRYGIALVNSPGTIDADYRGEVGVIVINHGCEPFLIRNGERIAQLVFAPFARASLVEVVELEESTRGSGGFGHTGR